MLEKNGSGFFGSLRFRYGLGLLAFLAIAGFFLWEEYGAYILGNLPLLLILGTCIGMHFFMHGSHGGGHGGGHGSDDDESGERDK